MIIIINKSVPAILEGQEQICHDTSGSLFTTLTEKSEYSEGDTHSVVQTLRTSASTIGSQLLDGVCSHGLQILATQP